MCLVKTVSLFLDFDSYFVSPSVPCRNQGILQDTTSVVSQFFSRYVKQVLMKFTLKMAPKSVNIGYHGIVSAL